jgi:hypothetical protein
MRAYIPDMPVFFSWMKEAGFRYVVLRGFRDLGDFYPARGAKRDVDFLVEDAALPAIAGRYGKHRRAQGVKCDFYNVTGEGPGVYLGGSYFPPALAAYVLSDRRLWKDKFYVPGARAHLLSLLYHITYQKSERSSIDISDAAKSRESKYCAELDALCQELGLELVYTLNSFHAYLARAGHSLPQERMAAYLQNDFAHGHKSLLLANVRHELPGELNLFVIRRVAVSKGVHTELIEALRKQYDILAVKEISWLTHITKGRHMRGGKWRRGGRPCIAVAVFDRDPIASTAEDRKIHPFVFNARQFMKRELRDWFTKKTGAKPTANPIHSTDNEAEAIGHLPLFFTAQEQEEILAKVRDLHDTIAAPKEMAAAGR